jgi:hypothetical protein
MGYLCLFHVDFRGLETGISFTSLTFEISIKSGGRSNRILDRATIQLICLCFEFILQSSPHDVYFSFLARIEQHGVQEPGFGGQKATAFEVVYE